MEPSWIDWYYEGIGLFYWLPNLIGRQKDPKPAMKPRQYYDSIRRHEETLSTNLCQFFSLAPRSVRNQLFGRVFPQAFAESYTLRDYNVWSTDPGVPTQPDLYFTGDSQTVGIEVKISAKSRVEQVLKYALLGLDDEINAGREKEHYLLFLTGKPFMSLGFKGCVDPSDLMRALRGEDVLAFLDKRYSKYSASSERFRNLVDALVIAHLTFEDLAKFIEGLRPPAADNSPGAVTYGNLIAGLLDDLKRRNLRHPSS